jgi:hypothetical protein
LKAGYIEAHTIWKNQTYTVVEESNHAIGVHGLANVLSKGYKYHAITQQKESHKFVVFKVGYDFLGESLGPLLEYSNTLGVIFLEFFLNSFHVALDVLSFEREWVFKET